MFVLGSVSARGRRLAARAVVQWPGPTGVSGRGVSADQASPSPPRTSLSHLCRRMELSPSEARERERSDLDRSAAGATTARLREGRTRHVVRAYLRSETRAPLGQSHYPAFQGGRSLAESWPGRRRSVRLLLRRRSARLLGGGRTTNGIVRPCKVLLLDVAPRLDEAAVLAFLGGHCDSLAHALHQIRAGHRLRSTSEANDGGLGHAGAIGGGRGRSRARVAVADQRA